jgi:hypothetical protein
MPTSGSSNWPAADTFQAPATPETVPLGQTGDTTRDLAKLLADIGAAWELMRADSRWTNARTPTAHTDSVHSDGPNEKTANKGIAGGYRPMYNVVSKTANYTALAFDLVLCNATGGAFNVTLPASPAVGAIVAIKKTDSSANAVTIIGTVDGTTNPTFVSQWHGTELVYDGTNWKSLRRPTLAGLVDYPATTDARYDALGAAAAAQAASQPLDSDLTAIAALTTTSYGRAFLALADFAAARAAVGLLFAKQAADFTKTSDAALTNTDLAVAMVANGVYIFEAILNVAGATTGDAQHTFTVPSGATGWWAHHAPNLATASGSATSMDAGAGLVFGTGRSIGTVGVATKTLCIAKGIVVMSSTPGNLQHQFAQQASDPTASTLFANSFLKAERVA